MAESGKFSGSVTNDQVVDAIRAQHEAMNLAERKLAQMVVLARRRGISWAVIGEALGGITKQSVQRKYAPLISADREADERKVADLLGLSDEDVRIVQDQGSSDSSNSHA